MSNDPAQRIVNTHRDKRGLKGQDRQSTTAPTSRGAQQRTWGTSYVYSPFTMSISWPSRALTRRPFFVRTHPIRSALIFALSFRNPSIRASGRTGQPEMKITVGTNVYAPLTTAYES